MRSHRSESPTPLAGRGTEILIATALAALTAFAYWGVMQCGFVNFDDPAYVSENVVVQKGWTAQGLRYAFTTFDLGNWHPMTWLSHVTVVELFGLRPAPHHAANLALHVLNTVLLFFVLRRATGFSLRSAVVAGLFGVHPLHVESVAWIAERKDVLSTTFWLASTAFYLRYVRTKSFLSYGAVVACLVLGLMSKPMLVTLPLVFLLMDYWPLRRVRRRGDPSDPDTLPPLRLVLEKLPLLLVVVLFSVLTLVAQESAGAMAPGEPSPLSSRAANAILALGAYLRKTVWPADLAVFYPVPRAIAVLPLAAAGAVIAAICIATLALARRKPYLAVGWYFFLVTLVPVLGLVRVGNQAFADRYTYVPHIGLFLAVVFGGAELVRRERWVAPALSLGLLLACCQLTRAQVAVWHDDLSLFGHAVEATQDNYLAHQKLAGALDRAGRPQEAIRHYQESIRTRPGYALAHNNLGILYLELHRESDAEQSFRNAISSDPAFADARANLGQVLCAQGKESEGVPILEDALRLDPRHPRAHLNLAEYARAQGKLAVALEHYSRALASEPGLAQALNGLAWIRATSADPALLNADEAVRTAERAAAATSYRIPDVLHTLGAAYARAGRFDDAVRATTRALDLASAAGEVEAAARFRSSLALFRARSPLTVRPR